MRVPLVSIYQLAPHGIGFDEDEGAIFSAMYRAYYGEIPTGPSVHQFRTHQRVSFLDSGAEEIIDFDKQVGLAWLYSMSVWKSSGFPDDGRAERALLAGPYVAIIGVRDAAARYWGRPSYLYQYLMAEKLGLLEPPGLTNRYRADAAAFSRQMAHMEGFSKVAADLVQVECDVEAEARFLHSCEAK